MSAKQSHGCLASKQIGQRLIFISVLLPALLVTAACQPSASTEVANDRAKQASDEPAIFQPQGSGKVTLKIVTEQNDPRENVQLFRIVGYGAIPIELPISKRVDSGFCMLCKTGEVKIPVPAIAPFVPVDGLTVKIGSVPEPEPEPGWLDT